MDEKLSQLLLKIDYLEKLYSQSQQNINYNLSLTWTILGVVVAIIGIALYFLAQMWVNKKVDIEMNIFREKYLKEMESLIFNNPQILQLDVEVYPDDNGEFTIALPEQYKIVNNNDLRMYSNTWFVEMIEFYSDGGISMEAKQVKNLQVVGFDTNINIINCKITLTKNVRRFDKCIAHVLLFNSHFKSIV